MNTTNPLLVLTEEELIEYNSVCNIIDSILPYVDKKYSKEVILSEYIENYKEIDPTDLIAKIKFIQHSSLSDQFYNIIISFCKINNNLHLFLQEYEYLVDFDYEEFAKYKEFFKSLMTDEQVEIFLNLNSDTNIAREGIMFQSDYLKSLGYSAFDVIETLQEFEIINN